MNRNVPVFSNEVFAVIKDKSEFTAIFREGADLQVICGEKFFKIITFEVRLPFELTGFLSYVSTLLANEDIPIFVISTYSTDHLPVREERLDKAVKVLQKNGFVLTQGHQA
ncbi:MAG: ACT domain-containing protein [Thermofilum sp.]|nr:ACT domain-containing protein [Thermofilum sp.]